MTLRNARCNGKDSKFLVLLHNISNYITTINQIVDIIMPSLLTTHHAKLCFGFAFTNNEHVFLELFTSNQQKQPLTKLVKKYSSLSKLEGSLPLPQSLPLVLYREPDEFTLNFHNLLLVYKANYLPPL